MKLKFFILIVLWFKNSLIKVNSISNYYNPVTNYDINLTKKDLYFKSISVKSIFGKCLAECSKLVECDSVLIDNQYSITPTCFFYNLSLLSDDLVETNKTTIKVFLKKGTNGDFCSFIRQCQTNNFLSCLNGTCQCAYNYYWDGSSCLQKKDFGVGCTISTECNDLIGLTCPSTSNTSSCASLAANLCDCPSGHYYNTTLKNCVALKLNGDSCSATCECKTSSLLSCVSGTCQCPSGSQSQWSIKKCLCVECPVGWQTFQGSCYYVSTNLMSWYDSLLWCQNQNATLMIVNDQNEFIFSNQFFQQYNSIWIGANATVLWDFRWTDESSLSNTSSWWCLYEPSNHGGNASYIAEGCVFIKKTTNGLICFDDSRCEYSMNFLCEKEP